MPIDEKIPVFIDSDLPAWLNFTVKEPSPNGIGRSHQFLGFEPGISLDRRIAQKKLLNCNTGVSSMILLEKSSFISFKGSNLNLSCF